MCSVCMTTTLAWVTASVASAGCASALIVSRVCSKRTRNSEQTPRQEEHASEEITTGVRRETWNR
jgi:hypothetical protein